MDIEEPEHVQIVLHTVPNIHRIHKVLFQMLAHLRSCWRILEPAPPDAVNPGVTLVDGHFWVNECVENDTALLVNHRHFAEDVLEV